MNKQDKKGFYEEKYVDKDGTIKKRVKLFDYNGRKFMAAKDGKLIPHECAYCFLREIFHEG